VHFDLGDDLFNEYYDRLLNNKMDYAKKIGVDFKLYSNLDDPSFVDINNYKHYVAYDLAHEYDEILYLDFDVIVNTDKNFFEENDLSKGIVIKQQNDYAWYLAKQGIDMTDRSPAIKRDIVHCLSEGKFDGDIINTGIMGGKSEHFLLMNYPNEFDNIKDRILNLESEFKHLHTINNEAIFSYLLMENKVPYQLTDKWHALVDMDLTDHPSDDFYFLHFINKHFWMYFKDKTFKIFSLYIDIPQERMINAGSTYRKDTVDKNYRTKQKLEKYKDLVLENQSNYAKSINADYEVYGWDKDYEEFREWLLEIEHDISEYNIINFYKIWLLEKNCKEYDYVLYLDFDVAVNTNKNFFEYNPIERNICVAYDVNYDDYKKGLKALFLIDRIIDYRSPEAKYWNSVAMLTHVDWDETDYPIYNTGIIGASKYTMNKLNYFDKFEETLEMMTFLKTDEDTEFPNAIQRCFGHDNETVFSFKIATNEVQYVHLHGWHQIIDDATSFDKNAYNRLRKNSYLLHFINKKLEWFFT